MLIITAGVGGWEFEAKVFVYYKQISFSIFGYFFMVLFCLILSKYLYKYIIEKIRVKKICKSDAYSRILQAFLTLIQSVVYIFLVKQIILFASVKFIAL